MKRILSASGVGVGLLVLMAAVNLPAAPSNGQFIFHVPSSGGGTTDCSANTCYYIRDGGSASTTGTGACVSTGSGNWNAANACDDLPSVLVRGAYYLVADGNYASRTFSTAANGTQTITIQKATASNHGTETGWVSTFGDEQAIWSTLIAFTTPYFIFDGQTRNESDWFSGAAYGFKVSNPGNATNVQMTLDIGADNCTVKYVWLEGKSGALPGFDEHRYAIDFQNSQVDTVSNATFHRMYISDSNNVWFLRPANGTTIEYCAHERALSNGANHGEVINLYWIAENTIIRYNWFRDEYIDSDGTALIAIGDDFGSSTPPQADIYGNIFENGHSSDAQIGFLGNASVGGNCTNCRVYNNTFVDSAGNPGAIKFQDGSGNAVQNNLFIKSGTPITDISVGSGGTNSHNGFGTGSGSSGTNAQTSMATSIFTSYAGGDYSLALATTAGATLSAPYNTDMLGHTRGADGTWDRGALEFVGPAPQPDNPLVQFTRLVMSRH